MRNFSALVVLCCIIAVSGDRNSKDCSSSPIELIESTGLMAQEHKVTTIDGYILTLHRIPNTVNDQRRTVFIQHGLFSSSADFLIGGRRNGLAYVMADAGYDVWLGNFRGNTYCRNHLHLRPTTFDFWRFEWNEIGMYDLPAMIDYVLKTTGKKELDYIGHSQGTTTFLVMTSEKPEYNDKIRTAHLMSPMAFMSNTKNLFFRILTASLAGNEPVDRLIGAGEFSPKRNLKDMDPELYRYCEDSVHPSFLCENPFYLIFGIKGYMLNETLIPEIFKRYPDGGSVFQLIHYAQLIYSERFCKYDFGETVNLQYYGSRNPPDYDLRKVTAKVALYYGAQDMIAQEYDVEKLKDLLPHKIDKFLVENIGWSYLDFLWGRNVKDAVYNRILENIRKN